MLNVLPNSYICLIIYVTPSHLKLGYVNDFGFFASFPREGDLSDQISSMIKSYDLEITTVILPPSSLELKYNILEKTRGNILFLDNSVSEILGTGKISGTSINLDCKTIGHVINGNLQEFKFFEGKFDVSTASEIHSFEEFISSFQNGFCKIMTENEKMVFDCTAVIDDAISMSKRHKKKKTEPIILCGGIFKYKKIQDYFKELIVLKYGDLSVDLICFESGPDFVFTGACLLGQNPDSLKLYSTPGDLEMFRKVVLNKNK